MGIGCDCCGSELHTAQHFTGQLTDGTGLIYMNARYYDPQLGQFISPDTLVPDATSLMDFNRYAYARGNPMKYNDPSGHNGISIEGQCECGGGLLPGEVASRQAAQAGLNVELTGPEEVSLINAQEAPVAPEAPAPSTPLKNAVSANDGAVAPPAADIGESGTIGEGTQTSQNWLRGTYDSVRSAGAKDSHHIIQDAAVRELSGYDRGDAPAVQLPGPANQVGTPHYNATQVQRQAGGGTYAAERVIGYRALRAAGLSPNEARLEIERADTYFTSIGVTPSTVTRLPGNRQ